MPATVIIPALDEEERIGAAIEAAFAADASEVIVDDDVAVHRASG